MGHVFRQPLLGLWAWYHLIHRDHFVPALSQWETTLHCNVVSRWLGPCTKWSLHPFQITATHCLESLEKQYHTCISYMYILYMYNEIYGSQAWNELQWFFKDEVCKGTANSFCETVEIPSGQVSTHCIATQDSLESLDVYLDQAITKEWSQPVTGHVPHLTQGWF